MTAIDYVKVAYWAQFVAAAALFISGLIVTVGNRNSPTIAIAFSTASGALLLFAINVLFQLVPDVQEDHALAEILLDTKHWQLLSPTFIRRSMVRDAEDGRAIEWLRTNNPSGFSDAERVTNDLILFGVVHLLATREIDWRLKMATYQSALGQMFAGQANWTIAPTTNYSADQIRTVLLDAKNIFADVPLHMMTDAIRLPPGAKLALARDQLTIHCPVVTFTVRLLLASTFNGIPTRQAEFMSFENRDQGIVFNSVRIDMAATFSRYHRHDAYIDTYMAWFQRLSTAVRGHFQSEIVAPSGSQRSAP